MDILGRLTSQLKSVWNNASLSGRIATVVMSVLLIGTVVFAGVWSSTPDYKLLRDGISPQLTGQIKSVLDTKGIPNRMNFAGTGVMVPASQWNKANVAIGELDVPAASSPSGSVGGIFPRPPGHAETLRTRERALERTIETLRAVKSASVHLAVPERSPFRSVQPPTSASVLVTPQPGQIITRELGATIIQMVAAAVEGLDAEKVYLADTGGDRWGELVNADPATKRNEFVRKVETERAIKAQEVLAAVLGPHKAKIRVTVEVDDYLEKTITVNRIDADGKVRTQEKITSSDQTSLPPSQGVAGTGSNGGGARGSTGGQLAGKEETNETSYDYPRTQETTQQVGGQIRRLWISGMVDVTPDHGDPNTPATPLLTQQQVEDQIKAAVGFDPARGDQIHVSLGEIADQPVLQLGDVMPESEKWDLVLQLARHASLGLAAVVALLIATMTLKKLQPIRIPAARDDQRRNELLNELSARVDQNPEAVSRILAAWLGQGNAGDGEAEPDKRTMKRAA